LVSIFLVGLLCGAIIVEAWTVRERAAQAQPATSWWLVNIYPPQDALSSLRADVAKLSVDCKVEITTMPSGDVILLYACPPSSVLLQTDSNGPS
jgi:hypothetical protein